MTGQKRGRQGPVRARVDQFPRGSKLMNELMAGVISGVSDSQILSNKLFQVRQRWLSPPVKDRLHTRLHSDMPLCGLAARTAEPAQLD